MELQELVRQLMKCEPADAVVKLRIDYPDGRTATETATDVYYGSLGEIVIRAEVKA